MPEFLHEVVRKRERGLLNQSRLSGQYVWVYGDVYADTAIAGIIVRDERFMSNIRYWVDEPSWNVMRNVFSDISCDEHRWILDVSDSSMSRFRYTCLNCGSRNSQETRGLFNV